ncbi:MAG: response regulator, partial [Rhodoferax sp.]|nr:response regulator [Rhodoferax sp.]
MAQTILVIDDSSSLRQVVAMALQGAGYNVLQACDGQAALALLDGRKIGMAICDVNMPKM